MFTIDDLQNFPDIQGATWFLLARICIGKSFRIQGYFCMVCCNKCQDQHAFLGQRCSDKGSCSFAVFLVKHMAPVVVLQSFPKISMINSALIVCP